MAVDRLLDLFAYQFLCFAVLLFSVLVILTCGRLKFESSLVNVLGHNKTVIN